MSKPLLKSLKVHEATHKALRHHCLYTGQGMTEAANAMIMDSIKPSIVRESKATRKAKP